MWVLEIEAKSCERAVKALKPGTISLALAASLKAAFSLLDMERLSASAIVEDE